MRTTTAVIALAGFASTAHGLCPHLAALHSSGKTPPSPRWKGMDAEAHARLAEGVVAHGSFADESAYAEALVALDWPAVKTDLLTLFKTSDPRWPSDYNNYAPFFVRLAWHTSGSYRLSDGRGTPCLSRKRLSCSQRRRVNRRRAPPVLGRGGGRPCS